VSNFSGRLAEAVKKLGNPVLVGLDPRFESLPDAFTANISPSDWAGAAIAYSRFCREVIDVVAALVPAVKPQAAFFEQLGWPGMQALAEVIAYARQKGLLVIFDGKRNDIGSTATAYARGIMGRGDNANSALEPSRAEEGPWGADALTVSPYLGDDSLQPFIETAVERSAGVFVLVKTSNPGGGMFQDLVADGRPLYRHVAEYVERKASETAAPCGYGVVGAVVGATYPQQLVELREVMPQPRSDRGRRGRRVRSERLGRDRQQLSGNYFRAFQQGVSRALRRRALARSRRGGDTRDDRATANAHAGGKPRTIEFGVMVFSWCGKSPAPQWTRKRSSPRKRRSPLLKTAGFLQEQAHVGRGGTSTSVVPFTRFARNRPSNPAYRPFQTLHSSRYPHSNAARSFVKIFSNKNELFFRQIRREITSPAAAARSPFLRPSRIVAPSTQVSAASRSSSVM
jgi:orotidine-5'-phosphate decarboxylase